MFTWSRLCEEDPFKFINLVLYFANYASEKILSGLPKDIQWLYFS